MTEILRALPSGVVETITEGAAGGRSSARYIVMAAHDISLEKWLVDNRDAVNFDVASKLCRQFGEVRLLLCCGALVLCRRWHVIC